jgi:polyhydroxyalkanoate synthesis regulator phasin
MVSIPGLRRSEEKAPPKKKDLLEQIEGADVDALIAKTEKDIEEANAAIARIEERVRKLQARKKYLEGVKELQGPEAEEPSA